MPKEIKFHCPKCRGHKVEEIQVGITVTTEIALISETCPVFMYGEQTNADGRVDRYQCGTCGYVIVDHRSSLAENSYDGGLDDAALVAAIQALNEAANAPLKKELET